MEKNSDFDQGIHFRKETAEDNGGICTTHDYRPKNRRNRDIVPSHNKSTAAITATLLAVITATLISREISSDIVISTEHSFPSAAVASDTHLCSPIGRKVLEDWGGSAVDAAIATLFCMGVVNLHSMGLGGGFFATLYDRQSQSVSVLDAREIAPGLSRDDMFAQNPKGHLVGSLSIGVPGEVAGYWAMHQRYGRLPWSQLIQPTIDMCVAGFRIEAALGRALQRIIYRKRVFKDLWPILFYDYSRTVREGGGMIDCPRLAETLRVLAKEGAGAFYNGSLSKHIVEDIQEKGGIITETDLRDYKVHWRKPLTFSLQDGSTLFSPPAPAGGSVLTLILNILQGYNFSNETLSTTNSTVLTYHRMVEAMKFAHAYKANLGDPDFVPTREKEKLMTSPEFGESLRAKIDDSRTFGTEYYGDTPHSEVKPGTAHLSLVDSDGNAVSVTSSLNFYCGSGVVGRRTGIIFNNALGDFTAPNKNKSKPAIPTNFMKPGKRPLSAMSPLIILKRDKSVRMVTGAAGGATIGSILAQIILGNLVFGKSLGETTDASRLHHQLLPPYLFAEKRFPREIITGLKMKGHKVKPMSIRGSVVQSIVSGVRELTAVSDNRKGGQPDGY